MAFDNLLAKKIEEILRIKNIVFEQKKMFGGLCFMINDKMCVGVVKEDLMVRVNPDEIDSLLKKPGSRLMDFTKKPLKGFLFIDQYGTSDNESLDFWIQKCLDYNPLAKSSKRKK